MTTLAQTERAELCSLLERVGPDAPTLCEGWTTADLAAHLVARERRPDAAPGVLIKPLAGYTEKVRQSIRARPYGQVIETIRQGPPLALRLVDAQLNGGEYFIHYEDVRRAQPDWTARELDPATRRELWRSLVRGGRLLVRKVPAGIGLAVATRDGDRAVLRKGVSEVTVVGDVAEIVLYLFGRRQVVDVELTGDDAAARQVADTSFGM